MSKCIDIENVIVSCTANFINCSHIHIAHTGCEYVACFVYYFFNTFLHRFLFHLTFRWNCYAFIRNDCFQSIKFTITASSSSFSLNLLIFSFTLLSRICNRNLLINRPNLHHFACSIIKKTTTTTQPIYNRYDML